MFPSRSAVSLFPLYLLMGQWHECQPPSGLVDIAPLSPSSSLPIRPTPLVYQMFNFGYVTIKIKQLAIPA